MSELKKVGIVIDKYKKRKFSRALTAAGFQHEIKDSIPGYYAIFIHTEESNITKIGKICKKLQIDFNQSN